MPTSTPFDAGKEALIIVNPASRSLPKAARLQEAEDWLAEQGWRVARQETEGRGDAITIAGRAAESGVSLVFVCGGDGTLNEAANGLAGSETALAVIPAGTVNIWAREAGLNKKPLEAVQLAAEGVRRRIDLGRAGSRHFLLMAGYGLDAAVTANVSHRVKGTIGAAAYAIASAREVLRYRSARIRLKLDGEEVETEVLLVIAGNTREYAGLTRITPEAFADDGLLDVRIYQGRGKREIMLQGIGTLLRRHRRSKKVLYRRVKRLEMEWETPLPLQLDGEACPDSPSAVSVAPAALWVAVPAGRVNPLFSRPAG